MLRHPMTRPPTQPPVTVPDVVLYHAECLDGFGAAWAIWKKFPSPTFTPLKHSLPAPRAGSDGERRREPAGAGPSRDRGEGACRSALHPFRSEKIRRGAGLGMGAPAAGAVAAAPRAGQGPLTVGAAGQPRDQRR